MLDRAQVEPGEDNGAPAAEDSAQATHAGQEPKTAPAPVAVNPAAQLEERETNSPWSSWFVWTGSAALVGLFVVRFAHDLSHEERIPPEPDLPFFPDSP